MSVQSRRNPALVESVDASIYAALTSANRLFSQSLDQPVMDTFAMLTAILAENLDLALALVGVIPEGEDWLKVISVSGEAKSFAQDMRVSVREDLPEGQGLIGLAIRSQRVVIVDIDDERYQLSRRGALEHGLGGGMAVPFSFPDGGRGVVCLSRRHGTPFQAHLSDLLDQLGVDITDFLVRSREHEQLARLRDYQGVVGSLLHRLLTIPDPNTAYIELTRLLIENTDASGAWVSVPEGPELRTVAGRCKESVTGLEKDMWTFRPRLANDGTAQSRSVAARAYRSGQPVVVHAGSETDLMGLKTIYRSLESINVAGAWPVMVSGKPVAVLVLVSDDPEYFRNALLGLLEQLVVGLEIAIQNFEAQAETRRISRVYQALLTEGDLLLTASNDKDFLLQSCARLLDSGLYRTVWIGVKNELGRLQPLVSVGDNVRELDLLTRTALGQTEVWTASMRAIMTGKTVVVPDYVNEPDNSQWSDIAKRNNWRSSVSVPIERHGMSWGVLSVMSDRVNGFSPDMVALLSRVSQMVSHGLGEIDLREKLNTERDRQSWLASHDPLTGLPNRRGLEERISNAMERSRRNGTLLVAGMLDLDDFKTVNDSFGHDLGDQALRDLTRLLRKSLRKSDLLARVGGDEFVLVLEDIRSLADLDRVLEKFEDALHSPLALPDGSCVTVGGSLGLSVYSGDELAPSELLHSADQALYMLKTKKGNRNRAWAFHSPSEPDGVSSRPDSPSASAEQVGESYFHDLLSRGGLQIIYEPIVSLSSGSVVGVAAIPRLVSPEGTVFEADDFVAQLGLDDQGLLALKIHATAEQELLEIEGLGHRLWCSIGVVSEFVKSGGHLPQLVDKLSKSRLGAGRVVFDVLGSSSFLAKPDSWHRLIPLGDEGFGVKGDDGHEAHRISPLILGLPAGKVKLDSDVERNLPIRSGELRFLIAMSELSRNTGAGFVAEGVETFGVLDALICLGVEYAQGPFVSSPLGFEELKDWLSKFKLELDVVRPATLLGLYALFVRDSFGYYQRLLSGLPVSSAERCPAKGNLENLGLLGTDLDRAHEEYHQAIKNYQKVIHLKPNPHLSAVEESRGRIKQMILELLD